MIDDEEEVEQVHLELVYDEAYLIGSWNQGQGKPPREEIMFGVRDDSILMLSFDDVNDLKIQSFSDK